MTIWRRREYSAVYTQRPPGDPRASRFAAWRTGPRMLTGLTRLLLAFTVLLLASTTAYGATRYDPRFRFRTISTPRFDVHFHQGGEAQARRLALLAEEVASQLDTVLGPPSGRVHVILVDQTDLANGWATPLPYNVIEITAAAPTGESLIGNTDDWLRLVFAHEYTHVVHMSRGGGLFGGLRKVFGRHAALYPNVFLPLWQVEGIATYQESALTRQGRIHAGDFRLIATHAAAMSQFLPLDRANGGLLQWPSGHAPYVYGAFFHEFLAERYGEDALRRLTDTTARRLPYFGSTAFRSVFGRSLGELWTDFEREMQRQSDDTTVAATRLTRHGFTVRGPRFARDGRLYYSVVNPHGFPALMTLAPGASAPEQVVRRYFGDRIGFSGPFLVFDQLEVVRNVGLQSDLYAVDERNGRTMRLTRDARAAGPDVSPDGRTIVCTVQRADRRELAILPMPVGAGQGTPTALISEAGTHFASPRWSPDGRWIAAERLQTNGSIDLVLVDPEARSVVRVLAPSQGRDVAPAWTPDSRRVLFSSDRDGAFRIFSVDVGLGEVLRLEGAGPHAQFPDLAPDGGTLVFVGYTPDGYDLFSMSLAEARWAPVVSTQQALPRSDGVPGPSGSGDLQERPYSPLRSLAPRFWTPLIESDAGEVVLGAATASADALGRHAYALEAGWAGSRARPDWQIAYAYDRWWPTIFLNVSDDTEPWRDGTIRSTEANVGLLLPRRRVRWAQSFLAAFHASTDVLRCDTCGPGGEQRSTQRAVRTGWMVDAARSYGYSIGEEDGWIAAITTELTREVLGAGGNAGAATVDVRGYLPVVPRHGVVAGRIAAAAAWGDDHVRRVFSASGHGPQVAGFGFGSGAIGLMRGVEEGMLAGSHAIVANVDYRLPLWRIERGRGTWPFFLRTLHVAAFTDLGHAFDGELRAADFSRSFGAELSLDSVVGYLLPLTVTGGVAWRQTPNARGAVFFSRIGRAF